jgi:hypothetical protein
MINTRHMLAGATLATAVLGSVFPAHAGLLGGSGSVGGGLSGGLSGGIGPVGGALNGTLSGQGTLQAPSPRPVIDRTQDKVSAVKDKASSMAADTRGAAEAKAGAAATHKPSVAVDGSGAAQATTQKAKASAAVEAGAAAKGGSVEAGGSAAGSIKR